MTVEQVRDRVRAISDIVEERVVSPRGTDPTAHEAEDDLRRDVLSAIAAGHPEPAELAREALKTADLAFSRWFD